MTGVSGARANRTSTPLLTTLIVALALTLRISFLVGAEVDNHIAGDINDYVAYAWNLAHHGVYSSTTPGTAPPVPDTFRPPGFPLMILLAMRLGEVAGTWLLWAYALQILISTATVYLTILLGRQWMPPGYALAAGGLLALWPHHVVFASTLLSETLLGFVLVGGLYVVGRAHERASVPMMVLGGILLGFAALVNTLVLPLPAGMALIILLVRRALFRRQALAVLLGAIALPLVWSASAPVSEPSAQTASDRAMMNLIQGAWPQYHRAWRTSSDTAVSRDIMNAIADDVHEATAHPIAGVQTVGRYIASDPTQYASWYLLEKPQILWGWDIQLGWGGIYFLPTRESPFERVTALRTTTTLLRAMNPVLLLLAIATIVGGAVHVARGRRISFALAAAGLLFLYVTFAHVVLQAEPRYSIAYRPIEFLLALTFIYWAVRKT